MNIEEKILWLYEKQETIAGIIFELSAIFDPPKSCLEDLNMDKGILSQITELFQEYDVTTHMEFKLKGD